ncbi:uncharacterized protein PHALS_03168 [Plasmopara halstedii]|uniref:Uncharacterized protein n=1 Tax=Plasmopara halstedii TaxID=4781 RepID=A0A0P1A549_PLAHL|nr:uncharacterized protein PHALS_03168 [Plasmopara halstedii]CEG35196.1 hypothetical protein PHALS_03168 [Plasmopara halstedii]|eukprot:XP_024571565.1 hypothetical protein PHALS_03168 [Plasmopara halstedii]
MAMLQDANDELAHLHSIIPAWIVEDKNPTASRKSKALKVVALKGAQSWLIMCTFIKRLLVNSGGFVDLRTACGVTGAVARKFSNAVVTNWAIVREKGLRFSSNARHHVVN